MIGERDLSGPPSPPKSAPSVLTEHLRQWLGTWPPAEELHVVGAAQRAIAGWDGRVHPVLGVADDAGAAVLSVPPAVAGAIRRLAPTGLTALLAGLPALLSEPDRPMYRAVFRWTTSPSDLPEPGVWVPADADGVPDWLRPFKGRVLVAEDDDGTHLAGVGIKRHDHAGHELSVVTTPRARGRGLARGLIAQAARQVLREGAVPTYIHELRNTASSRVADGAGFPDRLWTAFGISERPEITSATAHRKRP